MTNWLRQPAHRERPPQFLSRKIADSRIPQTHPNYDHQAGASGGTCLNPGLADHRPLPPLKDDPTNNGQRGSRASYIKVKKAQISPGSYKCRTGSNRCVSATCGPKSNCFHGTVVDYTASDLLPFTSEEVQFRRRLMTASY